MAGYETSRAQSTAVIIVARARYVYVVVAEILVLDAASVGHGAAAGKDATPARARLDVVHK